MNEGRPGPDNPGAVVSGAAGDLDHERPTPTPPRVHPLQARSVSAGPPPTTIPPKRPARKPTRVPWSDEPKARKATTQGRQTNNPSPLVARASRPCLPTPLRGFVASWLFPHKPLAPPPHNPYNTPMIAQAPTPDLPSLFADFLDASLPLPALAERHNLDLIELLDLTESEPFQAHIEAYHALQALRASLIQASAQPAAMATLTHLAASPPTPDEPHAATETRRKAARTILTHAQVPSRPPGAVVSRAAGELDHERPTPNPRATPHPPPQAPSVSAGPPPTTAPPDAQAHPATHPAAAPIRPVPPSTSDQHPPRPHDYDEPPARARDPACSSTPGAVVNPAPAG